MSRGDTKCLFCKQTVVLAREPGYGTYWTHWDGYRECATVTVASPDFELVTK